MIQIKYSKARAVETALKEAFRDLLSNNDKAFAQQNKGDKEGNSSSRRGGYYFGGWDDDESAGLGTSTFKGKLSFGVDESTNTLIVTTTGEQLLAIVVDMVDELDQAAVPTDDTRVVSLPAGLSAQGLRETLAKMFGPESIEQKPNQNGDPNQQNGQNPNQPQNGQRNGKAVVAN